MELLSKIKNRSAVVGVIGLGYVGLPMIIEFGKSGFEVIGFDLDEKKIKKLNEGRSYIKHIPLKSFWILGLAYKKDVDDVRESPSLKLIELLKQKGAHVEYNDPYIPKTHRMRMYDLKMDSVPVTEETLKEYDCVVIATDHSCYDYEFMVNNAQLIVDTRNATKGIKNKGNIVKA